LCHGACPSNKVISLDDITKKVSHQKVSRPHALSFLGLNRTILSADDAKNHRH
jgi:hypothetical protein